MLRLPESVLVQVFQYLNGKSLLSVETVSCLWCQLCKLHEQQLWKHNLHRLWNMMLWNKLNEDMQYIYERVRTLPISKLKKMLVGIDLSRCVEKADYQRMLIAHLVFGYHMKKELVGSDPRFAGKFVTIYYPEWALRMGLYKASYAFAKREFKRKELFLSELCSISWIFKFKDETQFQHPPEGWRVKFNEDYTMESELQPHHGHRWKV
jgi:hypothetical protein